MGVGFSMEINSIRIIGGGSAGWMTAAALVTHLPHVDIRVIEDPNTPHIGVGESTLGFIRNYLDVIGLKDTDFMKACNASYKLAIRFKNFYKKNNEAFYYPFGPYNMDGNQRGLNDWALKKIYFPKTPLSDFADCVSPMMALVNENKLFENKDNKLPNFDFNHDVAFHFDSLQFAKWLKENICLPKGGIHVPQKLTSVKTNDKGIYEYVLDNQYWNPMKADLFIDCTGFSSRLLGGHLKEPFQSYEDVLPNNCAWATRIPYRNKKKELVGYTDCEAINNGWVWSIPLWSRLGCGYVFSTKFISEEKALVEFKEHLKSAKKLKDSEINTLEFRKIPMRIGIHKRLWVKNVVAIGLSAGFIEPLESNGLYTVHEFIMVLLKVLKRSTTVSQFDKDCFNYRCKNIFDSFVDFVRFHYVLSHREDTPYWRAITNGSNQEAFDNNETPWNYNLKMYAHHNMGHQSFDAGGGAAFIAAGMNFLPDNLPSLMYREKHNPNLHNEEFEKYFSRRWDSSLINLSAKKLGWKKAVKNAPSLYSFLKKRIYK